MARVGGIPSGGASSSSGRAPSAICTDRQGSKCGHEPGEISLAGVPFTPNGDPFLEALGLSRLRRRVVGAQPGAGHAPLPMPAMRWRHHPRSECPRQRPEPWENRPMADLEALAPQMAPLDRAMVELAVAERDDRLAQQALRSGGGRVAGLGRGRTGVEASLLPRRPALWRESARHAGHGRASGYRPWRGRGQLG